MKLKSIIFSLALLFVSQVRGQNSDTVFVDDYAEFNKEFLSELTPSLYEGRLINRASLEDITLLQLAGKDNKTHNWANWMFLYTDIYNAYVDNSNRLSVEEIYDKLEKKSFDYRYPDTSKNIRPISEEIVHMPFALIFEEVYKLKDSAELVNYAEVQNNKLVPTGNEADLYEKIVLKSAAVLDVYNPKGYSKGKLHYEDDFIIHSSNITINNISIDVGNGFVQFTGRDNTIEYALGNDTTFAKAAVSYSKDGVDLNDTLEFILSVQPPRSMNKNNPLCVSSYIYDNTDFYDFHFSYSESFTSLQFDVGVIIGCGNESQVETLPHPYDDFPYFPENFPIKNIRRPIIILPPYRPNSPEQKVSMGFYYCKYNIDGFIDEMVSKGYDVIIIKEAPGSAKIATAGKLLADFITDINRIKEHNFPDESWENIVMGFSAGGQHARYALTALEKRHMQWGTPHHHTRLYVPVDSPHNGANVPVSMQTTFWEYRRTGNPIAIGVYNNLNDDASRDMLSHHIASTIISVIGPGPLSVPLTPTNDRLELMDELNNSFNHQFSHNDQRRSFPSFTRNIAASMGRFDQGYDEEYGLGDRELMFRQILPVFYLPVIGFRSYNNALFAAPINPSSSELILRRMETRWGAFTIPASINRFYYTAISSPGYDQARGGHKNVFFDGLDSPWAAQFVGAVQVMRSSAFGIGVKHYKNNVNFMPLTSAFAIKDGNTANVLQNFNPQNEDMMFQSSNSPSQSNHFGYPHLGRPNDHFNITPFEAIYTDNQTYEHIDVINSVDPAKVSYLDSIRVFLRDEIEGENFYLQNKTIGKNHVNWLPDFEYKAWYKADKKLYIGHKVTPKTNKGDYIIEETGNITVYAGDSVIIKPGFHTKSGSTFHAFIQAPACVTSNISGPGAGSGNNSEEDFDEKSGSFTSNNESENNNKVKVYPNPNNGSFNIEVTDEYLGGEFMIFDTYGKKLYLETIKQNRVPVNQQLERGVYFVAVIKSNNKHVEKIIVQ